MKNMVFFFTLWSFFCKADIRNPLCLLSLLLIYEFDSRTVCNDFGRSLDDS